MKATFKFIKRNFKVLAVTFVASAVVTAGITGASSERYQFYIEGGFEQYGQC